MKQQTLGLMAILLLTLPALGREEIKTDPLATITKPELRDHIFYLASDFLQGRLAGSEGYKQASYYIASQLQASGLAPMIKNAKGQESYFQPIDFVISTVAPESVLRIQKGQKEMARITGDKFFPAVHCQAFKDGHYEGKPVFVGYGIDEPEEGWNDYKDLDVSGKIVVMIGGTPLKDGRPRLSAEKNAFYANLMESASKRLMSALNHKAEGIVLVLDSGSAKIWPQLASTMNKPARRLRADEKKERSQSFPVFFLHPEAAGELLKETGFDPISGKGRVRSTTLKDTALIFDLKYKVEREFACQNVVGFIPGSDPALKEEYVVVDAHLDHLGLNEESAFNGADDNASGCASLLEAAEAAVLSPPRRSLFFVFTTGEEKGGHGAFHFVDNFPFPLKNILLAINVDMVGRNSKPFPDALLGLSPDTLKLKLAEFMDRTNKNTVNVNLKTYVQEADLGDLYGGSDEVVFHMRGVPAVLITGGFGQPDYHKISDDPDKINFDKVVDASRLIFALAMTAANAEKIY